VAAIGHKLKKLAGPFEAPLIAWYRWLFFSVDGFAQWIRARLPASRILEVGCGEGQVTQRLAKVYPEAWVTGIDIIPGVGRLFRGSRRRVTFLQEPIETFALRHTGAFDLVVMCDVLHHAPWDIHRQLLTAAKSTIRPGGWFVLKDWEKRTNAAHLANYLSDEYLTGGPVRYYTAAGFRSLVGEVFGAATIKEESRLPPWPNNIVFLVEVPFNDGVVSLPGAGGCEP
jgi:2-polyprenyl-6-hydroxyphenyl methylase/3-demethylubiquinone-9 3-methyltransferase